ncbi:MAG: STAS domain-containing protein [Leptonema sp. (in: Bacteria)]|nr:STAS domain-containing protein [Leptonema sp. (in: bacteria)]
MDSISKSRKNGVDILTVKGSLEHVDSPIFEKELESILDADSSMIVLDLSSSAHICSSALGALIAAKRKIRRREGDIRIVVGPGDVLRVLQITLLDRVFLTYDNLDAAAHSFFVRDKGHENP